MRVVWVVGAAVAVALWVAGHCCGFEVDDVVVVVVWWSCESSDVVGRLKDEMLVSSHGGDMEADGNLPDFLCSMQLKVITTQN